MISPPRSKKRRTRIAPMWNKPCAECLHCIPIGDGEGLCDYPYKIKDKFIVDLFDIEPNCPYKSKGERSMLTRKSE